MNVGEKACTYRYFVVLITIKILNARVLRQLSRWIEDERVEVSWLGWAALPHPEASHCALSPKAEFYIGGPSSRLLAYASYLVRSQPLTEIRASR